MNKKKLITLLLTLCALLPLASCGRTVGEGAGRITTAGADSAPADSETTAASSDTEGDPNRVTFVAAGDNLIHDSIIVDAKNLAATAASTGAYSGTDYFDRMYDGIRDIVSSADLAYVNQEGPVAGDSLGVQGYPTFNAPEEVGDALREGRIAAVGSVCLELSELNYREACFEGEPANIGFPRSEGNGIYVTPNMLFVNAGSKGKDGAYEFLRFLVSEEGQRRYVERNRSGGGVSLMPIRLDILDEMTALEMRKAGETTARSATGVLFVKDGFTQEQKERFDRLLEKAEPGNWHAAEIMSIVYEELEPYFAGQRTAAETAANLDNRVQLYMDERK